MTSADLLARYLRQRKDLGESELIFEGLPLEGWASIETSRATVRGPATPPAGVSPSAVRFQDSSSASEVPVRPASSRAGTLVEPGTSAMESAARSPAALQTTGLEKVAVGVGPLAELKSLADSCTACGLAQSRRSVVFGEGNLQADLIVVGEAPGADEDASGRPFVGAAGRLLDLLLASVGLPRETVYICNVLKCRPPGNRNPAPLEVDACSHLLHGQISTIRPKAILACGTFAAQTLLTSTDALGKLRTTSHVYQGVPLIPTYHPAALLRNPSWVRSVWADLQRLRQILDA